MSFLLSMYLPSEYGLCHGKHSVIGHRHFAANHEVHVLEYAGEAIEAQKMYAKHNHNLALLCMAIAL